MELIGNYHEGISNSDYHAQKEFISSSQFKTAIRSHANYRYILENGKDQKEAPFGQSSRDWGSLVHCLVLEPHMQKKDFDFIDLTGENTRLKVVREKIAKFCGKARMNGKIPMTLENLATAKIAAEKLMEHPFAKELLTSPGRPEISGYAKDPDTGLSIRWRPDYRVDIVESKLVPELNGKAAILDLKTSDNITWEGFRKKVKYDWHYDLSAYQYLKGDRLITGEEDVPFIWIVIESVAPYRPVVYMASKKILDDGAKKYYQASENIKLAHKIKGEVRYQEAPYEVM